MTLVMKLTRRRTARGRDVESEVLGVRQLLAGFIVKPPLIPLLGTHGLSMLRETLQDKLVVLDLKVDDDPEDLEGLADLAGYANAVTISWRAIASPRRDQLVKVFERSGVRPVIAVTNSDVTLMGLDELRGTLVSAVKGLTSPMILLPGSAEGVVKDLVSFIPGALVLIDGVRPGEGLCVGARYEVIGQNVLDAQDPVGLIRMTIYAQKRAAEECGVRVS